MSAQEKQKKKPRRVNNNDMHVQCEYCKVNLKLEVSSTINCKCYRYYYCSNRCKGRSEHGKSCETMNFSQLMAGLSSCEPMNAKETASYSALHGKSFKELLKMEDDPMACKIISWTLTMDACQAATAFMGMSGGWNWKLPPAYEELPFAKREELSIEWLRKAHKLGDHEAALLLGNTICCDISENFHLDFRDGLDYLMKLKDSTTLKAMEANCLPKCLLSFSA